MLQIGSKNVARPDGWSRLGCKNSALQLGLSELGSTGSTNGLFMAILCYFCWWSSWPSSVFPSTPQLAIWIIQFMIVYWRHPIFGLIRWTDLGCWSVVWPVIAKCWGQGEWKSWLPFAIHPPCKITLQLIATQKWSRMIPLYLSESVSDSTDSACRITHLTISYICLLEVNRLIDVSVGYLRGIVTACCHHDAWPNISEYLNHLKRFLKRFRDCHHISSFRRSSRNRSRCKTGFSRSLFNQNTSLPRPRNWSGN